MVRWLSLPEEMTKSSTPEFSFSSTLCIHLCFFLFLCMFMLCYLMSSLVTVMFYDHSFAWYGESWIHSIFLLRFVYKLSQILLFIFELGVISDGFRGVKSSSSQQKVSIILSVCFVLIYKHNTIEFLDTHIHWNFLCRIINLIN